MRLTTTEIRDRIIPSLRRELTSLQNGTRHIYAGAGDKPVREITTQHIAVLEEALASYERIISSKYGA